MFRSASNYWYILKAAVVLTYACLNIRMILRLFKKQPKKEAAYIHREDKIREKPNPIRKKTMPIDEKTKVRKESEQLENKTTTVHNPLRRQYIAYIFLIKHLSNCIRLRCVSAKFKYTGIGTDILALVGIAWLCEKLNINLKLILPKAFPSFFANSVLIYSPPCKYENFSELKEPITHIKRLEDVKFRFIDTMAGFAAHRISSQYGYKVISQLSIQRDLCLQADEWYRANIKGNCIAVHYRGTDVLNRNKERRIKVDSYINYLKKILDKDSYLFACSDQAQFINRIKTVFPDQVAARNIKRSYTHENIHFEHDTQQKRDAFIDLLILAKTELIYTTGGCFIDCVRFLNPSIKIISLEYRHYNKINSKHIPNYLPIPEEGLVEKMKSEAKNWQAPYF